MNLNITTDNTTKTVKAVGIMNSRRIAELRKELEDSGHFKIITIDLEHVVYSDTSLLSLIVNLIRDNPSIKIKLLNPNECVHDLLRMAKIHEFKEVFIIQEYADKISA